MAFSHLQKASFPQALSTALSYVEIAISSWVCYTRNMVIFIVQPCHPKARNVESFRLQEVKFSRVEKFRAGKSGFNSRKWSRFWSRILVPIVGGMLLEGTV
jgi:hypothetical protein